MARVFLSHSSKDKDFVRKLAADLTEVGHSPWLDEWEIRVGDCIITRVEGGIRECDYVVIVLSKSAVESTWVNREWKAKYWEEIESGKKLVLPVLLETCERPPLLASRLYADFRQSYLLGFTKLVDALNGDRSESRSPRVKEVPVHHDASAILSKLHSPAVPLSQCLVDTLTVARALRDKHLEQFARRELQGWSTADFGSESEWELSYRAVQGFVSPLAQLNLDYAGFNGMASRAFEYMRLHPDDFTPYKFYVPYSVPHLESHLPTDPEKGLLTIRRKVRDFDPDSPYPEHEVMTYLPGDTFMVVLHGCREALTSQLLTLLPEP